MAAILYVSHAANLSGAPISLMLLCREMAGRGHETFFVTPQKGPLESLFPDQASVWRARGRGLGRWTPVRNLHALIKEKRFDIAHVNCIYADYGAMAAKKAGLPILWHIRENLDNAGYFLKKKLGSLADLALVPSKELKERIVRTGAFPEEKIRVIPNGVDVAACNTGRTAPGLMKEKLGLDPNWPLVGTVGTLCPRKDTEGFILAAARVALKRPDARFLVVGNEMGSWKGYLLKMKKLAGRLGLEQKIVFHPATPGVFDLMNAMDVFVLPSRWEGMPRVLLEAMALAKPVVATRVGGVPELVLDTGTGFLAPPGSPGAIADAVAALLNAPAQSREMGLRARAVVEKNFSLKAHADKMERIYEAFCPNP